MAVKKQRLPEPEELFLDYVKRMARHRDGREVMVVHMSKLDITNRDRHHIELVTMRLGEVARAFDGRVFPFVNGDVGCVVRNIPASQRDNILFDIRYNFSEDALVIAEDAGEACFIQLFDMRWDYDDVEAEAKSRVAKLRKILNAGSNTADDDEETASPSGVLVTGSKGSASVLKVVQPKKIASLLDMDRRSGTNEIARQNANSSGIAGPLDAWLKENVVRVGGAQLPLETFVSPVPLYELGRRNDTPTRLTLWIDQQRLSQAYSALVGMKMNDKLGAFLVQEVEMGLIPLISSLTPAASSQVLDFGLSAELSPEVILSPTFLLEARKWQDQKVERCLFWFNERDVIQDREQLVYVTDFLRDLGHLIGLRGIVPSEIGSFELELEDVDHWCLKWPETDLSNTPRAELEGLARAVEAFGPSRVFLQHIATKDQAKSARAYGFRFAESMTRASDKLFTG
jgi:hypothetical protein